MRSGDGGLTVMIVRGGLIDTSGSFLKFLIIL